MKKSGIKISAILVAYNSHKCINKCILSIQKAAEYANIFLETIVVINDKSKRGYKFPSDVKVISNKKNYGYAKGINIGAEKAKGEWLLIANPDTITDKKALYYLLKNDHDRKIAIIGPKIYLSDGSIQFTINKFPSLYTVLLEQSYLYKITPFKYLLPKANLINYSSSHHVEALEGTYFLIRKKYFEEINNMDERFYMYFEDMDLCKRINDNGNKILFESKAKINHSKSVSSGGTILAEEYVKSFRKYFLKYYSQFYTKICLYLLFLGSFYRKYYWLIYERFSKDKVLKFKSGKMREYYQQMIKDCLKYILFIRMLTPQFR